MRINMVCPNTKSFMPKCQSLTEYTVFDVNSQGICVTCLVYLYVLYLYLYFTCLKFVFISHVSSFVQFVIVTCWFEFQFRCVLLIILLRSFVCLLNFLFIKESWKNASWFPHKNIKQHKKTVILNCNSIYQYYCFLNQ